MCFKKYENEANSSQKDSLSSCVKSFDEDALSDALLALEKLPFPAGNRVAILGSAFASAAGCEDFMHSTAFYSAEFSLPELSTGTQRKIREVFPQALYCWNPVDIGAAPDAETYAAVLEVLLKSPDADILLCQAPFGMNAAADENSAAGGDLTGKISALLETSLKPVLFYCPSGQVFQCPVRNNIVGFPTIARVIRAAQFLVDFKNNLEIEIIERKLASAISYS